MSSKNFNILVVVTIVLVVVSVWMASRTKEVVIGFVRGQELVSSIDTDRLTRIQIKKGDAEVVLQKVGNSFRVENRDNYPADGGRINNLIQQCGDIQCVRKISDTAETHAELQVDGGPESTVVKFLADETEIVGLIIGKGEDKGQYVRLTSSQEVFLSEESIFIDTEALSFVDKSLTDLKQIEKVEVTTRGNSPYVITKKGNDINLLGIPEGMVAKSGDHVQVFNAAQSLTFRDFMSEATVKDLEFANTYRVTTEAGEQYTFQLASKKENERQTDWFAKITGEYVGPANLTVEEVKAAKDDPELQKKQEAILQAGTKIKQFNDKHQSWVYKLESWGGGNMAKDFKDLIEEDKAFIKLDEKSIETVVVKNGDAEAYTISSPSEGKVDLLNVPDGKKAKGFDHHLVFTATTTLEWTERKKPDDEALKDVKFDSRYTVKDRAGAQYTFDIGKKEDKFYMKASAAFVGDAKSEAAEAVIAKGAVAKFNERHKAHVYEVASGIGANMVKDFADLIMDGEKLPEEIQASHILVAYVGAERSEATRTKEEAKKRAEELHAQVMKSPDDFAKVATENSDGPSKDKGGDLGVFKFDTMAKPFSEAAFRLEPGQISEVVETKFGFHIIKRTK